MKSFVLMMVAACGLLLLSVSETEAARRCRGGACAGGQCAVPAAKVVQSDPADELFSTMPVLAPRRVVVAEQPAGPAVELPKVEWVKVPAWRWRRGVVRYKPVIVKPAPAVGAGTTQK